MSNFCAPTKIIWDIPSEDALDNIFKLEGWKRIGVVIDSKLRTIASSTPLISKLESLAEDLTIFEHNMPEPDTDYADRVAESLRNKRLEVIIGIGGGSGMDIAKAVAVLLTNEKDTASYQGMMLVEKPGLPTVMVPTTAGTGSETTWTAVFTNKKKMFKRGLNGPYLFARYAILDARLTNSLPPNLTLTTGMDALAHSIESFTAKSSTIVSRMFSRQAFTLLFANFPAVLADGENLEARSQMLLGSALAGCAITNAGTGACHSFAYPLGTHFHVPHGTAMAILLTTVMHLNAEKNPALYNQLWDTAHPDLAALPEKEKSFRLIDRINSIIEQAGFKTKLSDFKVTDKDLDFLAEKCLELKSALENNPVDFGAREARMALEKAL